MNKKLNKIIRYSEKIPCDKRLHMLVGVFYTAILTIFTVNVFIVIPFLVVVAWGIKVYQKFTKSGSYGNWDAIVAGGLIVYLSHIL